MQHREVGVGGQPVLGAQPVQRFNQQFGAEESAGGEYGHADVGDVQTLGGDCGAEIDFIADDEICSPPGCQPEQSGGPVTGNPASEAVTDRVLFLYWICGQQRSSGPRRDQRRSTTVQGPAAGRGHHPEHRLQFRAREVLCTDP